MGIMRATTVVAIPSEALQPCPPGSAAEAPAS